MSEAFTDSQLQTSLEGDEMGDIKARKSNLMQLNLREKGQIYMAYMPFIKNGGLFIPTTRNFKIGEEVFMLMRLLEDPERLPITAKVVWSTPENVESRKPRGFGFQFSDDDPSRVAKNKIENILAEALTSEKVTFTL